MGEVSMLPEEVWAHIFSFVAKEADRSAISLVCSDWHRIERMCREDFSAEFPELLQLVNVSFSYPSMKDFKLSDVDFCIDMRTRVVIVGPNGSGKSTLLNLLAGDLFPTKGKVRRKWNLRIGRYSPHSVDLLTMEENPLQYLLRLHPNQERYNEQEQRVRAMLGKFGLVGNNQIRQIANLSGGQKAHVVFTSILMSKHHILLLDEPANHLDMQSIDVLAEALKEFYGGVVLVSNNLGIISRVCKDERSEIWVVEKGTVRKFPGSFEEYKKDLQRKINAKLPGIDYNYFLW